MIFSFYFRERQTKEENVNKRREALRKESEEKLKLQKSRLIEAQTRRDKMYF